MSKARLVSTAVAVGKRPVREAARSYGAAGYALRFVTPQNVVDVD